MKKLYAIITFCLFCGYPLFSQTISSNAPLCGNTNLTLELIATGGNTYAWTGPNGFTSTLQNPTIKNVNWKNRGVYTVIIDGKTTLTTDVNIQDPVAFTVPKEISVCEGGTLVIEPKSGRLTDSTEVADSFKFKFPFSNFSFFLSSGIINNFTSSQVGICQVTGLSSNGCSSTQNVDIKLNTNSNCKSIQIEDLAKVKVCYGQEVIIPFSVKGSFPQGTKFKAYVLAYNSVFNSLDSPIAVVEKSPFVIKNLNKYFDKNIAIIIIADDTEKTTSISNYTVLTYNYLNYSINSSQTCDSSILSINNSTNSIDYLQWYLDGVLINGATKNTFTTKKSGIYSFKFREDNVSNINKTCLYESQPVKIELGKIEKPSAYISNNIELCVGKPATLNVSTNTNTTYRWKKDGNYIVNANKSTFETLQEGKYQIEAKEGTCTAVSDTVVLKKPERLESFSLGLQDCLQEDEPKGFYQLCNNQSFKLISFSIPSKSTLQYIKNGVIIKDSSGVLKSEGTYVAKATYGQCEGYSLPIIIKYDKFLKINSTQGGFQTINQCYESNIYLNFNTERLINTFNDYKCLNGYIYKDGKIISDWEVRNDRYNANSTSLQIKETGNYYAISKVLFKDGSECAIYSDTANVNFTKKVQDKSYYYDPVLKAVPINTCKDTTNISSNNSIGSYNREISYKWTKDGVTLKQDSSSILQVTQAGTYQLETTYKGGCVVASSPYKVEFGKLGVSFNSYLTSPICEGSSVNLYPNLTEKPDKSTYDFTRDGKTISTQLQSPYTLTQSGTYKLKVSNGKCEGTSPDFVLKVDKIPTTITPTDSVTFCAGKTVDLKASTEAGLSYIWERNGSVISQANQATLTASTDGLYKATLLRSGCWGITPSVKLKSLANITPTATLTGDKKIDLDQETNLSVNLTSHAPWTFKLSDGKEYTATKSPFDITVKPLTTTTYSLTEVNNICGTGTVSGTAKIEIIILSIEEEKELSVEVFPMPSSEICNWKIETPQATMASVELIDVSGSIQFSEISNTRSQTHQGSINLTNLKAGTYFLKLQAGEKSVTRKVVKF